MELDLEQYWTFGLALAIVLILIGILFWVIQKIGVGGGKGRRGSRLGIVEAAVVDRTRRLVLVRRDTVEHLVMIGGPQDVVIENNITRSEPSLTATATDQRGGGGPDLSVRPGAQAAVTSDPASAAPVLAAAPLTAESIAAAPEPEPQQVAEAEPPASQPEPETPPAPVVERPSEPEPEAPEPEPVAAEAVETVEQPEPEPEPEVVAAEAPPSVREIAAAASAVEAPEPQAAPEASPRATEEPPRPTTPSRPWPPSEGRFREAQRRFAERSDYNPPGRGGRSDPAMEPDMHHIPERQVAGRAAPDGMMPPERPREVSHEGSPREPANLNVRPGEDR